MKPKAVIEGLPAPESWVERRFVDGPPEEAFKPYQQDWGPVLEKEAAILSINGLYPQDNGDYKVEVIRPGDIPKGYSVDFIAYEETAPINPISRRPPVTKKDLIQALSVEQGVSRATITRILEGLERIVKEDVILAGRFRFAGLGVWKLRDRKAMTTKLGSCPAHQAVHFRPDAGWRKELRG